MKKIKLKTQLLFFNY